MLPSVRYPALNAKMKGMYANNLSKQDYEELLSQANLKDAIIFLKNKFPVLENLNENMHRKAIEQELNNLFGHVISKLFKYLNKDEVEVFKQILVKYRINYVKNSTNTESDEDLKNIDNNTADMFQKIYATSEKVNKDMQYIVGTEIDLLNIIWIYRAKKYFKYSKQEIREILIPINYKINKKRLEELLNCTDFNDMQAILNTTVYKKVFTDENKMEYEKDKYLHDINIKMFRTKMFDICTVYAIFNLIDIEIKNIINIIEGIRYKLDKSEIQKKIII